MNVWTFFPFLVWNSPLITLSLRLRGQVATKGREIIILAKSQPPFDVHRQYLDISLIDPQARVSRFRCRIFHCFGDFLKILLDYHQFLSLKGYWHMIFLHLESFENKLVDYISQYSKNRVFTVKPP